MPEKKPKVSKYDKAFEKGKADHAAGAEYNPKSEDPRGYTDGWNLDIKEQRMKKRETLG